MAWTATITRVIPSGNAETFDIELSITDGAVTFVRVVSSIDSMSTVAQAKAAIMESITALKPYLARLKAAQAFIGQVIVVN